MFSILPRYMLNQAGRPNLNAIPIVVITAKELTAHERARLSGQIQSLLQKGSFIDDELIESLADQLG